MIKSFAAIPEFLRACLWVALATLPFATAAGVEGSGFLEPEQAFRLTVEPQDGDRVAVSWQIAPGYYLYRDRMKVTAEPAQVPVKVALPPGDVKRDPNFGTVRVYHEQVHLDVHAAGATALHLVWQGCAQDGVCYPPQQRTVALSAMSVAAGAAPPDALAALVGSQALPPQAAPPSSPPAAAGGAPSAASSAPAELAVSANTEQGLTTLLQSHSLAWTVPLFVLLGLGLSFTPCVLPMLPIVSGIAVGSHASPRRAFVLSLAFVLAMAVVYALLGTVAALAGSSLQAALQNPWAIGAGAALFALLALAMFGWYELQLPASLRDRLATAAPRGGSMAGAAALGALSALLVSPCMTAPLAGTLLYIAQTGNAVQGATLLFALGVGMGLPMLAIASLGARVLPRPGPWMDRVKAAFGFALLATALALLQRIVPASAAVLLWGTWLAALAFGLWSIPAGGRAHVPARTAALVAGLWSAALVLGASAGATDPWRPLEPLAQRQARDGTPAALFETVTDPGQLQARLQAARASGRPVLVDFSADWCTSCKTLDREVFDDPAVRQALAATVRLRADVTANDAAQQALLREYEVMGPPTVMLFDARGHERREDRLVGEFTAADLLARVQRAGGAS